jgi:hypothetical protein
LIETRYARPLQRVVYHYRVAALSVWSGALSRKLHQSSNNFANKADWTGRLAIQKSQQNITWFDRNVSRFRHGDFNSCSGCNPFSGGCCTSFACSSPRDFSPPYATLYRSSATERHATAGDTASALMRLLRTYHDPRRRCIKGPTSACQQTREAAAG